MDFLTDLLDSFIPRSENGYKPHFFRARVAATLALVIMILAGAAFSVQKILVSQHDFLAAVIASALVDLTNIDRGVNGLGGLATNPVLTRAAQLKADDMAAKSYFAHTSPEGVTPWHWFKEAGYSFVYAGENLATYFSDSADVERAWMNSPAHRANILNGHFTEIGIATAEGVYQGRPTVFVVQEFGAPAVSENPQAISTSSPQVATSTLGHSPTGEAPKVTITSVSKPASTTSSNVLGTTAEELNLPQASSSEPKIIMQDDTFIAVKNELATNSPLAAVASANTSVSMVQRILTSPRSLMNVILMLLAVIISVALALMIGIELKKQHPLNILYGVALLVLIAGIIYLWQFVFGLPSVT